VPIFSSGASHPRFDEATLTRLRPDAWIACRRLWHFVQIFALPQVIAMIEQFLKSGITRETSSF
jgi:hypothetical protein